MFNAQDFATRLSACEDRWSLLKDFITEWHGPLKRGDGYPASELNAAEKRLGLKLPAALREWYGLAGRREDVFAMQNLLVSPEELEVEEGLLEFYYENQGVVTWGIKPDDLHLPDPPVYLNDSGMHNEPQELIRENETLSEFALQMAICEMIITREPLRLKSNARDDKNAVAKIEMVERKYLHLGFPDWHWPNFPVRFYGADDTIAVVIERHWLDLVANNQAAFTKAKEFLDLEQLDDND